MKDESNASRSGRVAHILVIEDDETVGQVLVRMLQYAGHDVVLCPTAAEAFQTLQALPPDATDLVIADMFLPDRRGLDLITELRKLRPHVPLIAITGGEARVGHDLLSLALQLGAAWGLRKPFGSEALLAAVSTALGQRAGEDPTGSGPQD